MLSEIERALLGDREAQEVITARGELLRCPWCGGEARVVGVGKWRYAVCKKCTIEGPVKMDIDEARLAWNTRAPILTPEELEKLEKLQ